jgi:transcription initiation factor TFIIE subunit beta
MGFQDRPVFLQGILDSYSSCLFLISTQHDFNFRNKASLLTEIQRHTKKGGGIPVRSLKESWKEAPAAIEELEKEGDVLVTRTAKDGQLKMVFWNEIKPTEEEGGMPVEQGA